MLDGPKEKTDKSAEEEHDPGTMAGDEIDPQQFPKPDEEAAKDEDADKQGG